MRGCGSRKRRYSRRRSRRRSTKGRRRSSKRRYSRRRRAGNLWWSVKDKLREWGRNALDYAKDNRLLSNFLGSRDNALARALGPVAHSYGYGLRRRRSRRGGFVVPLLTTAASAFLPGILRRIGLGRRRGRGRSAGYLMGYGKRRRRMPPRARNGQFKKRRRSSKRYGRRRRYGRGLLYGSGLTANRAPAYDLVSKDQVAAQAHGDFLRDNVGYLANELIKHEDPQDYESDSE